jgi:hypothetical protein
MEIWKDIDGFDKYQISNFGRIRSLTKKSGGRLLTPIKTNKGYLTVRLYNESGYKQLKIHRLVALTFIDNPLLKEQVNHINGIKTDNNINNLEWVNNQENQIHAISLGLSKIEPGEKSRNVKLTQKQVDEIKSKYIYGKKGLSQELSQEYNISTHSIRSIWYGNNWKS